jgi:hypothetical protein
MEDSMQRWSASPFGPPIWVRRGGLRAKHVIKARCYWEQPWGIHWEPDGNLKGTEEKRNKSSSPGSPSPSPKLKRKKFKVSAC